jgi:hypothetical protein
MEARISATKSKLFMWKLAHDRQNSRPGYKGVPIRERASGG